MRIDKLYRGRVKVFAYETDELELDFGDDRKAINGSKVVVLGVAYKRDIDDVRESPGLDIIQLLEQRGADVVYHDPYVASVRLEGDAIMHSTPYSAELLAGADCVVIVTDHSIFDWQHVLDHSKLVVDSRNATVGKQGAARIEVL